MSKVINIHQRIRKAIKIINNESFREAIFIMRIQWRLVENYQGVPKSARGKGGGVKASGSEKIVLVCAR